MQLKALGDMLQSASLHLVHQQKSSEDNALHCNVILHIICQTLWVVILKYSASI